MAFVEEGKGLKKTEAKREAARKMIDRIKGNLDSINVDSTLLNDEQDSIMKAEKKYPELSVLYKNEQEKLKINPLVKVSKYYLCFKESFETKESLNECMDKLNEASQLLINGDSDKFDESVFLKLKDKFQDILDYLKVMCVMEKMDSVNDNIIIIYLRINVSPDICKIGIGKTEDEAYFDALKNAISTMKTLLN